MFDYTDAILKLPESEQDAAWDLLDQLNTEFNRSSPDYGRLDRLDYQLQKRLEKTH